MLESFWVSRLKAQGLGPLHIKGEKVDCEPPLVKDLKPIVALQWVVRVQRRAQPTQVGGDQQRPFGVCVGIVLSQICRLPANPGAETYSALFLISGPYGARE